jgi:hypothetical protein
MWMNKKALLIVIPLLAVLSLTVIPAFAAADENFVSASGWAFLKTSSGVCYSGCAGLGLFTVSPNGGSERFVSLGFQGLSGGFNWLINLDSIKVGKNFETFCATPAPGGAPAPITVAPFCVTAFGCGFVFVGKVTTTID